MNLDLTDDEAAALLRELDGLIDGDREAETAGGMLNCPAARFRWLIKAGCCSASLLKFPELCSRRT